MQRVAGRSARTRGWVGFIAAIALLSGCSSGHNSAGPSSAAKAGLTVVGAPPLRALHGRVLAVGVDAAGNRDVWVLSGRGLANVTRTARLSLGGTGCYYGDNSNPGPCYPYSGPFSLSRDGRLLAFFLQYPLVGESTDPILLVVSHSDGSGAHEVAKHLFICALCDVSTPSWDRDGLSFVFAAAEYPGTADLRSIWKIYRVWLPSGRVTRLSRPGASVYGEREPVISPSGRVIAFIRNNVRGIHSAEIEPSSIELMQSDGGDRRMLPLPVRDYDSVWWCSGHVVCADATNSGVSYRVDISSGRVSRFRHRAAVTLSEDSRFSATTRIAANGNSEVLAGRLATGGRPRMTPVVTAASNSSDPFAALSISNK